MQQKPTGQKKLKNYRICINPGTKKMKLKKVLKNIKYKEIKGNSDIEVSAICSDSRTVSPNSLFIARKGLKFDATNFTYDAVAAGAVAIMTDIYDPFLKNVTQIISDDIDDSLLDIANNFYENPSKDLSCIAVTGTNGKTTTSYLIKHILDSNNNKCGLMGTVEYIAGENKISSKLTTPDCITIQKFLKEMVNAKCTSVCMEASSHGIEQQRLKNIDFDIAIFTNLTLDHLDYHKTFENYKNSKKKLFDSLSKKSYAVVNADDESYSSMIKDTKAKVITYSLKQNATLMAANIKYSLDGSSFVLKYQDMKIDVVTNLVGKFNIYNILAAFSASICLGIDPQEISKSIKSFKQVAGRLEKVSNNKNKNIYVDFAHSDDALINVLQTLREVKKGRIINVFGCGGDRDRSKRPKMAKASELYSDISIVTSDNPRSENPSEIIDEIISGFSKNANFLVEADRKKAIEKAISLATDDDIVIITGKGHETYQIFKNTTIDFDDREISKEICLRL
jgi:UDP-N-acetylmuramoyl-L-alanyl-D-glutamate--2,6-diaminopimelate ligase